MGNIYYLICSLSAVKLFCANMAETSAPAKVEAVLKTAQELISSCQELPENYMCKGSDAGTFDAPLPLLEIPIIDAGLLISPLSRELEKLRSALFLWGLFQV